MPFAIRLNIFFAIFICLAIIPGCTEDPVQPAPEADFRIDLISPYNNECPDTPFTVRVEANKPIQRVEFTIDSETVSTVYEEPFEYLWNIALWADGGNHFLIARGYDAEGQSDSQGNVSFVIPTTAGGILVSPPPNSGLPIPTVADLRWRSSPSALNYEVVLSLQPDFSNISNTALVADTSLTMTTTEQQWQYWRVRPQYLEDQWGHWSESSAFYGGVVFDRVYTHPGSNDSAGEAVRPMPDGGYIVAGLHDAYPLVHRLDPMGEIQWTYAPYIEGRYNDLVATSDGGCLLVGKAQFFGFSNLHLTRLDSEGNELWSHSNFGSDTTDEGYSICRCTDGGYVAVGRRAGALWLVRFDEQGWLVWEKTYGNGEIDTVLQRPDGGFILTGKISYNDFVLLGTDSAGNEQWRTLLDGEEMLWAAPGIGLVEIDSGYVALDSDGQLHRFDAGGQFQSFVSLGYGDYTALEKTLDGGYIVSVDYELIGLDDSFQELWRRPTSGQVSDINLTNDGGFIITGYRNHSRVWLLKTNAIGIYAPPEGG